jgi:hypothetical protein
VNVRIFVSLDTESGIVRRYSENANPTHEAGLTHDPDDAVRTQTVIEGFRQNPHMDFRVNKPRVRTYEDAVAEQRARRERNAEQQLLLGPPLSHRDEA